ncbi:hypothetical protein INT45_009961 [Circinella minor]|uniref:Protein PBN1 n=1 Tax=Circinella minor TaxID=1195481 RepID=A0A8H7VBX7_9FUNG|nr:hypothetical protein INT45_009961 [Circinella minor]
MVQVSWHFDKETSFHPHIITRLESIQQEDPNCWFDIIYQLPASVFVDPNQVDSNIYVFGETDLEAPLEHVKEPRGSTIIIRKKQQDEEHEKEKENVIIDLPIHLRYQRPSSTETYRSIKIPKPRAGWTCKIPIKDNEQVDNGPWTRNKNRLLLPPLQENALIPINKMDPSKTVFQDVLVTGKEDYLVLYVPVGRTQDLDMVQMGTMVAVVTCTLWIILATWKSITKRRRYDAKGKRRRSE